MKNAKNARKEKADQEPRVIELEDDENEDSLLDGDEVLPTEQDEARLMTRYRSAAALHSDGKKKLQITSEISEPPTRQGMATSKAAQQAPHKTQQRGVFNRLAQPLKAVKGGLRRFG